MLHFAKCVFDIGIFWSHGSVTFIGDLRELGLKPNTKFNIEIVIVKSTIYCDNLFSNQEQEEARRTYRCHVI
jgi:hypothetical protein